MLLYLVSKITRLPSIGARQHLHIEYGGDYNSKGNNLGRVNSRADKSYAEEYACGTAAALIPLGVTSACLLAPRIETPIGSFVIF